MLYTAGKLDSLTSNNELDVHSSVESVVVICGVVEYLRCCAPKFTTDILLTKLTKLV